MPMGVVSDSDFNSELDKLNQTDKSEKIHVPTIEPTPSIPKKGRGTGSVAVPDGLRRIIGDESVTNGREAAVALANDFGISASSVSAYSKGATSTASYDERPNRDIIVKAKERISKKARARLMMSLNHLTDDKMETTNAKDLSGIAKDMSVVIRNMDPEPDKSDKTVNGPTFVVYSPQFKQENNYQTLVVKE